MAGPARRGNGLVRMLFLTAATGLWWWAALRLTLQPDRAGMLEPVLVAGGWSLSLLPVHCVPRPHAADPGARSLLRRRSGNGRP